MKPANRIPRGLAPFFSLAVLMIAAFSYPAVRADDTLRGKRLKLSAGSLDAVNGISQPVIVADTLWTPPRDSIQISGYDKPLRTSRETFLVTNATSRTLNGIALTVSYLDMQGRRLHERTDTLPASIPAGDTRMMRISTWDSQHSYYYHRGQKPRTANVTPYNVHFHINFIFFYKE